MTAGGSGADGTGVTGQFERLARGDGAGVHDDGQASGDGFDCS